MGVRSPPASAWAASRGTLSTGRPVASGSWSPPRTTRRTARPSYRIASWPHRRPPRRRCPRRRSLDRRRSGRAQGPRRSRRRGSRKTSSGTAGGEAADAGAEGTGPSWSSSAATLEALGLVVPPVPVGCGVGDGRPASAVLPVVGETASGPPPSRLPEPGTATATATTAARPTTAAAAIRTRNGEDGRPARAAGAAAGIPRKRSSAESDSAGPMMGSSMGSMAPVSSRRRRCASSSGVSADTEVAGEEAGADSGRGAGDVPDGAA